MIFILFVLVPILLTIINLYLLREIEGAIEVKWIAGFTAIGFVPMINLIVTVLVISFYVSESGIGNRKVFVKKEKK